MDPVDRRGQREKTSIKNLTCGGNPYGLDNCPGRYLMGSVPYLQKIQTPAGPRHRRLSPDVRRRRHGLRQDCGSESQYGRCPLRYVPVHVHDPVEPRGETGPEHHVRRRLRQIHGLHRRFARPGPHDHQAATEAEIALPGPGPVLGPGPSASACASILPRAWPCCSWSRSSRSSSASA